MFHNGLRTGTLRVKKHVVNDNGGTKSAADFTLHVKSGATEVTGSPAAGSETGTAYTLTVGSYVVSEDGAPTGYAQTGFSGDCNSTGAVTVVAGAEKTCTITNDDVAAQLTVIKHVVNSFGGTATAADFTMSVTGNSPAPASFAGHESPGTVVSLGAGSYSVTETGPSGYSSSFSTDCTGSIAVGQAKTCTVTNSDIQPRLTVTKVVLNDNGRTATVASFTLNVGNTTVTSGVQTAFNAGTYTVSESGPSGYAPTFSGDCDAQTHQVALAVGDVKSCTITNDDIAKVVASFGTAPNPTSGAVGVTLNDGGTLVGATPTATGTITFRLYAPGVTCPSGTPAYTDVIPVSGNGSYGTASGKGGFPSNVAGTWRWTAEYSGDDFNERIVPTADDCNLETVTITTPVARLSPGYWKNHLSKAKLPQTLGNYSVDDYDEATAVYGGMNCSNVQDQNAIGCLAGHLLAAKLNVANGADGCIGATIAAADLFLKSIGYSGPTGSYPTLTATQRSRAISLKTTLDQYNNNISCP